MQDADFPTRMSGSCGGRVTADPSWPGGPVGETIKANRPSFLRNSSAVTPTPGHTPLGYTYS